MELCSVPKGPRLGQEAFTLSYPSCEIRRTIVDRIGSTLHPMMRVREESHPEVERYGLLHHEDPHFLDFQDAVRECERRLHGRIASDTTSKADERAAKAYLEFIRQPDFLAKLRAEPLAERRCFLGFPSESSLHISEDDVPKDYFRPGDKVYAIITPGTHYSLIPTWRPRPYFLLETDVAQVSFAPRLQEKLSYDLGSHFSVPADRICATEPEARQKLAAVFAEETDGTIVLEKIRCISVMEEARAQSDSFDAINKAVGERLAEADKYL